MCLFNAICLNLVVQKNKIGAIIVFGMFFFIPSCLSLGHFGNIGVSLDRPIVRAVVADTCIGVFLTTRAKKNSSHYKNSFSHIVNLSKDNAHKW